jgi:hypothetical protein
MELAGFERNTIAAWRNQLMVSFPGVPEPDMAGWATDPQVSQYLRHRARTQVEDERAGTLEKLQHELKPIAFNRIDRRFRAGEYGDADARAIRYKATRALARERRDRNEPILVQHYKHHIWDGDKPVVQTVTRTFPPVSQPDRQRKEYADSNQYMSESVKQLSVVAPLAPNPGLHLLGRTNIQHGMRPTPIHPPAYYPSKHATEYFTGSFESFDPGRTIVHPGKETYLADLETTLADPPDYTCSEAEFDKAVLKYGHTLGLRHITGCVHWEAIGGIKLNGKASSGVALQGIGSTRGQCAQSIKQLGTDVIEETKRGPVAGAALYQLGGRAKRTTPARGEKLRSRAIIFNDGLNAAVSSTISQAIGESLKAGDGAVKIGHRAMQGASEDAKDSEEMEEEFEIDHKRFGFRLAEPHLVNSFGLIRAALPPGEEWDFRILREMAHAIIKTIVLAGGWVYRCTFGNWSGPWTSIIDSFCNWSGMCVAARELKLDKDKHKLWIYGDDTLLSFRPGGKPAGLTPARVQRILRVRFGIYEGEASTGKLSSYGSESGATFLGCWNRDGFHGRPLSKWVDISVLPEKRTGEPIEGQIKRMRYLSHAAVATRDNEEYFTDYFTWLNRRLPPGAQWSDQSLRQYLRRTFVQSHANFSSGSVDWRDWEYGAKTSLCELQKKCRNYQRTLAFREISGRTISNYRNTSAWWLGVKVDGERIGVCGAKKSHVAEVMRLHLLRTALAL